MNQPIFAHGLSVSLLLTALGIAGAGCIPFGDPGGPGASGQVSLGSGVDATAFVAMVVHAVPDDAQRPFDPTAPAFPTSVGDDALYTQEAPTGVTFPHPYEVSESIGTTPHEHWRVFVWLSHSQEAAVPAPASGEPFGTQPFSVDGCGSYGDFCGVTSGIDVTLDQTAP